VINYRTTVLFAKLSDLMLTVSCIFDEYQVKITTALAHSHYW